MNTYLISQNNFCVKNSSLELNKNNFLKIDDSKNDIFLRDKCTPINQIQINLNNLQTNIHYRYKVLDNLNIVEMISCGFENLKLEFHKTCEVKVFDNCLLVLFNNIPYTYYFVFSANTYIFETQNEVFIFNSTYCVKFDFERKTFSHYFTQTLQQTAQGYEILCNLPKNIGYSILFGFDNNNKSAKIKKLKHNQTKNDLSLLPYLVFYLAKNNFEELKNYVDATVNAKNLSDYLSNFENIYNIDGKWYLTGKDISFFNFKIKNNVLFDID